MAEEEKAEEKPEPERSPSAENGAEAEEQGPESDPPKKKEKLKDREAEKGELAAESAPPKEEREEKDDLTSRPPPPQERPALAAEGQNLAEEKDDLTSRPPPPQERPALAAEEQNLAEEKDDLTSRPPPPQERPALAAEGQNLAEEKDDLPSRPLPPQERPALAEEGQNLAEEKDDLPSRPPPPQERPALAAEGQNLAAVLDKSLLGAEGALVRVNWETLAWAAILILAVVSRFYALGARGMSHDESLHAVYSLDLYRNGSYQHDPMMHGPFLFHANAFIFFLFGVSDATARVMPALAGIGAVMMAWLYRRWIGRAGALLSGALLLISPSLLFHSRYIRNDIYIVLFAMIWIYGMFRFVEERLESREKDATAAPSMRWLYLTVAAMALGFATKENQFMSGTIFGVFMLGAALWRWRAARQPIQDSPFADLAVLLLTLVLPFIASLGHYLIGWDALAYSSNLELGRSGAMVLLMAGLSVAIAYWWFGSVRVNRKGTISFANWATLMLLFWAVEIVFFTTFFTNPVDGLASGVVGSLGYWLAQQEVQRGSQPWYYYMMQGLLYEFLPLILSLGGIALLVGRLRTGDWGTTPAAAKARLKERKQDKEAADPPAELASHAGSATVGNYLVLFLAWWAVAAWLSYSYAGEKMPWLMTHMAQPMTLFGGWACALLLLRIDWRKVRGAQAWWLLALLPALLFTVGTLVVAFPLGGRGVDSLARTARFILAGATTAGLLYLISLAIRRHSWGLTLRLAALAVVSLLFLLTVRFTYLLNYVNYDMATEYLVYAHASPDVKRAIQEIETISQRTVGEREIRVSYDDDVAWPMTWYMRFYPNHVFYGANPTTDAMSAPIVLVGSKNYDKVEPYVARDYVSRSYRLIWWPEESYKGEWDGESSQGLSPAQIWGALTDPERRSRLWQIFFYRNHPDRTLTEWPHRHDFRMYVRRDIADIVWDLNVVPVAEDERDSVSFDYAEIERNASGVYSGVYGGLPLNTPRSLAVGPDGRRYLVDTGNHRVVVLNADSSFALAIGSACFLSDGEGGGCVDPDGGGPLELGDGQFREPWGVAVAADGRIFVADTWNGRIQSFDSDGRFLNKWGVFGIIADDDRDPLALFGPRGLAALPSGNLLVADTGNKRLVEFTPEGEYVRQVGGGGIILGRFEEPVDVAVHPPTGNILVTDIWNRRIQVLSADLIPLAEWPMPTWEGQDIWDKAFVAAAADGTVYATDPQFSQVFVISADGVIQASFGKFGSDLNQFARPTGIAIDPLSGELLVADSDNNRILVFRKE